MVPKEMMMYLVEICTRGWCQLAQLAFYLFNVGNHFLNFLRRCAIGLRDTERGVNTILSPGWIHNNGIWVNLRHLATRNEAERANEHSSALHSCMHTSKRYPAGTVYQRVPDTLIPTRLVPTTSIR